MVEETKPQDEATTKAPDPREPQTGAPADTGQADYGSAGQVEAEEEGE